MKDVQDVSLFLVTESGAMETSGIGERWGDNQPRPRMGQVKKAPLMSRSRLRSLIRAELTGWRQRCFLSLSFFCSLFPFFFKNTLCYIRVLRFSKYPQVDFCSQAKLQNNLKKRSLSSSSHHEPSSETFIGLFKVTVGQKLDMNPGYFQFE